MLVGLREIGYLIVGLLNCLSIGSVIKAENVLAS